MFLQSAKKKKTKRENVYYFDFSEKIHWGAVTFFSISIQKVGFLPTYQKK